MEEERERSREVDRCAVQGRSQLVIYLVEVLLRDHGIVRCRSGCESRSESVSPPLLVYQRAVTILRSRKQLCWLITAAEGPVSGGEGRTVEEVVV